MASGGHNLAQQRHTVERELKTLVNQDLKDICKTYNHPISGTKVVLQGRCISVLDNIVARGDQKAFDEFRFRVKNHGNDPPPSWQVHQSPHGSSSYQPAGHGNMARLGTQSSTANRVPAGGRPFKSSVFYEVQGTVVSLQDLPEQPQNRYTHSSTLKLSDDAVRRLKDDPSLRLLIYCGMSHQITPYSAVDVSFPNQIEVKVNNEVIRHNFKGLKNKQGSTKPADITSFVRKVPNYSNQIQITYALTTKRFSYLVHLVKHVNADTLTERIRRGRIISKEKVLAEMNRANADPDIAATSTVMSLKDPISTMRITLPIRSSVCAHNQCFDGAMFMQLQEQAPTWQCPVCSKSVHFESLAVDKYVEDILTNTSKLVEKVTVEPNGEWRVSKIEEEDDDEPRSGSNRRTGSYENDFDDDDLVEVTDTLSKSQTYGSLPPFQPAAAGSPFSIMTPTFQTPPLSSREASVIHGIPTQMSQRNGNKRDSSAVIDLTLSDDDEPPRPAKRQTPGNRQQFVTSHPYNSPASLPEPRYNQSSHSNHTNGADNYRPSSSTSGTYSEGRRRRQSPQQQDFYPTQQTSIPPASPSGPGIGPLLSPTYAGSTGHGWATHQPRPSPQLIQSGGFQPFSIRPPSTHHNQQSEGMGRGAPGAATHQQQQRLSPQHGQDVRLTLPPMQTRPPSESYVAGWRSDGRFSGSPG